VRKEGSEDNGLQTHRQGESKGAKEGEQEASKKCERLPQASTAAAMNAALIPGPSDD
jgi:hypothetical protein